MVLWGLTAPIALGWQLAALALVLILGIPRRPGSRSARQDPSLVVSDEVAGMIVTYLGVTTGWAGWVVGFFWFRVFDILKPPPVRAMERLPGGVGITLDDVLAGVYANIALRLTLWITGW